jgi:hypothetical protein
VVRVGPTFDEIKWSTVALVSNFLTLSTFDTATGLLLLGRAIKDVRTIFVALAHSWERVTDPTERAVLEAICILQASLSLTNYDALQQGRFEDAFGRVAPEELEIKSAVRASARQWDRDGPPSDERISHALQALRERKVLEEHAGRWSVIF